MKKGVFLLLILIFSINLVFAVSYECSDGSEIIKKQKEIDLKNTKIINGISLGLSYADEAVVFRRYFADLIIDAHKFSLTDLNPSVEIEFKSGINNITLVNLTNNIATISIGGSSASIENTDTLEIGGFTVFLFVTEGSYPGIATVEGIVGKDKISLNSDEPSKIISFDSRDYALELSSASNTNAIMVVRKCDNSTAKIIEIVEEIVENSTSENSTVENSTISNLTLSNGSIENKTETTNISQEESQNSTQTKSAESEFGGISAYTIIITFIIFLILVFVFFLIKHLRGKMGGEDEISQEEMNESINS